MTTATKDLLTRIETDGYSQYIGGHDDKGELANMTWLTCDSSGDAWADENVPLTNLQIIARAKLTLDGTHTLSAAWPDALRRWIKSAEANGVRRARLVAGQWYHPDPMEAEYWPHQDETGNDD